jgi:phage gp45-like
VTFAPSNPVQTVQVNLVDDSMLEDEETFQGLLTLAPGGGRVMIGDANVARATIEDDDSKHQCS